MIIHNRTAVKAAIAKDYDRFLVQIDSISIKNQTTKIWNHLSGYPIFDLSKDVTLLP
jgi:hypothetical protein